MFSTSFARSSLTEIENNPEESCFEFLFTNLPPCGFANPVL
jgi:hypothetical protein